MTDLASTSPLMRETVSNDSPIRRSHLAMLLGTGLVATSFPVGAAITNGMDALVLTFLRFALAAALFAPFVWLRHGLGRPGWRDLLRYGFLSAFLVGFFWAMFVALRHTSTLNTATLFALTPAITAVAGMVLLKDRLNTPTRIALPLGVVGVVWVVFRGDIIALLSLEFGFGDGIFLAGTVSLGLYTVLVKHLHRGEPMARMTFWTLATGALWLFGLSAPALTSVDWPSVPVTVFAGIAYLAVFTTLVTFFIFQWSATVIGPTRVMSYTYLNPALVLAIGYAAGEGVPPAAVIPGILLILAATFVLQRFGPGAAENRTKTAPDRA